MERNAVQLQDEYAVRREKNWHCQPYQQQGACKKHGRKQCADTLMNAESEHKQATQFTTTHPNIAIDHLRDLGRRDPSQDRGRPQADRPQGRADLEGDAALLDDRRAGLRPSPRRHDDPRRRQGEARQLLRAARRGRARLHHGQAAGRAGRGLSRRAARDRIRHPRDRDRRCAHRRTRARSSTPSPTTAPRRASCSAAGRSARWTSTCAGSAASCTRIPRSRRPGSLPACSVIRRWASLARQQARPARPRLQPGQIVLAGSFTRVVFAQKGDTLHADFGQLGGIAIQFV